MQVPLIRLQCGVNSYAWGKTGRESAAAKFAAATQVSDSDFTIQDDQPYAEVFHHISPISQTLVFPGTRESHG